MNIEIKHYSSKLLIYGLIINLVLYRLANYYKSKSLYHKSLKIYKKILDHYNYNDRDLFLYASNLDKMVNGKKQESFILKTFEKKPTRYFHLKLCLL